MKKKQSNNCGQTSLCSSVVSFGDSWQRHKKLWLNQDSKSHFEQGQCKFLLTFMSAAERTLGVYGAGQSLQVAPVFHLLVVL